jgi:hypothetical protein
MINDAKTCYDTGSRYKAIMHLTGFTTAKAITVLGKTVIRVAAASAMMAAWNLIFFSDEEDDLPQYMQGKPHLIFGRRENGDVRVLTSLGSLGDFLTWFGFESIEQDIKDIRDVFSGDKDSLEVATDMAKVPFNNLINSISPFVKTPTEVAFGQT